MPASEIQELRHELEALRKDWWWLLILGVSLMVLGFVAIALAPLTTIVVTYLIGFALLIGGIAEIVSSFWTGKWSGFMLHLLIGILYLVAGIFLIDIDQPLESAVVVTAVLAIMLIVLGIFRIVASLTLRFANWGWPLLNGVISLILGLMIYKRLPFSALWVLGLFAGIELIFNGVTWIMLAITVRHLPEKEESAAIA